MSRVSEDGQRVSNINGLGSLSQGKSFLTFISSLVAGESVYCHSPSAAIIVCCLSGIDFGIAFVHFRLAKSLVLPYIQSLSTAKPFRSLGPTIYGKVYPGYITAVSTKADLLEIVLHIHGLPSDRSAS